MIALFLVLIVFQTILNRIILKEVSFRLDSIDQRIKLRDLAAKSKFNI